MGGLSSVIKVATLGLVDPDEGPKAAKKAAQAQAAATGEASQITKDMFDQTRLDLAPGRAVGNNALFALAGSQGVAPSLRQLGLSMGLDDNQLAQLMARASGKSYESPRTSAPTSIAPPAEVSVNRVPAGFGGSSGNLLQLMARTVNNGAVSMAGNNSGGTTFDNQGRVVGGGGFDPLVEEAFELYSSGQNFSSPKDMVEADPGYKFRLDQGTKALERSAAARGGLFSGKTGKSLQDFSQGLASQEYGNAYNRLASLAGIGQSATNQMVNANQNTGAQLSDLATQGGNARASGYIGAYQADPFNAGNLMNMATQFGSAAIMSDRRTKEDINLVGKTDGGFPVYTFRYIGQPTVHMGVMAQDIETDIPDAVIEIDGIKHVDYSKVH